MIDTDPDTVGTRDELVKFLLALRTNLVSHPENWENSTLESFFEAMSAWINDEQGWSRDYPGREIWRYLAGAVAAASMYE